MHLLLQWLVSRQNLPLLLLNFMTLTQLMCFSDSERGLYKEREICITEKTDLSIRVHVIIISGINKDICLLHRANSVVIPDG